MKTNDLIYFEMRADEGYMLTNGEIYTTYVCVLKEDKYISVWSEVPIEDVPEDILSELKENKKED